MKSKTEILKTINKLMNSKKANGDNYNEVELFVMGMIYCLGEDVKVKTEADNWTFWQDDITDWHDRCFTEK